jgi:hypothetical protein
VTGVLGSGAIGTGSAEGPHGNFWKLPRNRRLSAAPREGRSRRRHRPVFGARPGMAGRRRTRD